MFYMRDKPSSKPDVTEWIECSWTVYVSKPGSELPLELGVRCDLPQFTVRDLDPSFLGQAYTILLGKTELDVVREYQENTLATEDPARRIAAGVVIPNELTVHLSVYSDKVSSLLAAMDEQRIVDMARRWYVLLLPSMQQHESEASPSSRQQLRESVLRELARLARNAVDSSRRLMCRVEFRRCTKDPATGQVHRIEETRH